MDPWQLRQDGIFLNHGSFGACPVAVLNEQRRLREELESAPVPFMAQRLPGLLDAARDQLAIFLGAEPLNLVFVRNATEGVNTALASLDPGGKELLLTSYGYPACRKAVERWWLGRGGHLSRVELPFPPASSEAVAETIAAAVGPKTRVLLIDHVTSATGLVLPLGEILDRVARPDLQVIVDGAHAPGALPLSLEALGEAGVTFYTGNLHKWCCAPKGAAFLWINPQAASGVHPLVTSHGWNREDGRPRLWREFDWTGTDDPTAWLVAPFAIEWLASQSQGGWPEIRRRLKSLLMDGAAAVEEVVGKTAVPEAMIQTMKSMRLPDGLAGEGLRLKLWEEHRLDVHLDLESGPPLLRISAFLYNRPSDYEALATALRALG